MNNTKYQKIKIDELFDYNNGSTLDQQLNDYYQLLEERDSLLSRCNIADMNQIVISSKEKPIIGTQALDTCYGILLYDRKNKFGICGHASPDNIIEITIKMLKHIKSNEEKIIEYSIIAGYRAIEKKTNKEEIIIEILKAYSSLNSKIEFTTLNSSLQPSMPENLLCYDFAFDTQSGKDITNIIFMNQKEIQNKHHI